MRKLGCLVVLVIGAAVGWMLRDRIVGGVRDKPVAASSWEQLTPEGAARMRNALEQLRRPSGPLLVTVRPGDLASFVYEQLVQQLPPSADSVEAGAFEDRLYVRASVKPSDFGTEALGPLASFLDERERMQFGGGFEILRPGLAQFRVTEIRFHDLKVPTSAIPRLLRKIGRGARPPGLAADGLPLVVPTYISEVKVEPGRVTLYRVATR
jgi:hypothetical protein